MSFQYCSRVLRLTCCHIRSVWVTLGDGWWWVLARFDFDQYRRRVDGFEYRAKRRDVPRDVALLLELARDIELEERIILDLTDNVMY